MVLPLASSNDRQAGQPKSSHAWISTFPAGGVCGLGVDPAAAGPVRTAFRLAPLIVIPPLAMLRGPGPAGRTELTITSATTATIATITTPIDSCSTALFRFSRRCCFSRCSRAFSRAASRRSFFDGLAFDIDPFLRRLPAATGRHGNRRRYGRGGGRTGRERTRPLARRCRVPY